MADLYVDTNVLIDFLLQREEAEYRSTEFLRTAMENNSLFISALSYHIIMYVVKPKREFRSEIAAFFERFVTVSLLEGDVKKALDMNYQDYEDVIQYQHAVKRRCDSIITRDKKDFLQIKNLVGGDIKILTPVEWMSLS